jgi:restriction system protein
MIEKVREATSIRSSAEKMASQKTLPQKTSPAPAISSLAPHCPQCGDTMVKRVAKKGTNSGSLFWGALDSQSVVASELSIEARSN